MNKFTTAALSTLLAAGIILPTLSSDAEARRGRGTALAVGAVLGLGAAAALAGRPAYADDYGYRRSRYRRYCDRLAWRCEDGSRRACWRYDDEC